MSQFVDEWVYGSSPDTGKTILYTVNLADGSAPDYSTATGISLVAVCRKPQRSFTLTGSVASGTSRQFSFPSPCTAATAPGAGERDVYEFRVTYTYNAKVYWTSPSRLSIVSWP